MREIEPDGRISDVIAGVQELFGVGAEIWFRGQPAYGYSLVPSLFRQKSGSQFDETHMYREFIRRHPAGGNRKTVPEWLALMQHYRVPTRLLDWTTNLLVALYFCCTADPDQDGAIFAFDPTPLLRDFEFNPLLEIQVLAASIADFYRKLIFQNQGILDDDAQINSYTIGRIKQDIAVEARFTHIMTKMPLESVAVKRRLVDTVDVNGNPVPHDYADITRALSNVVPLKNAWLGPRAKRQHGYSTLHGGKYFGDTEFIKIAAMEEHAYLTNNLTKMRIRLRHKQKLLRELELSGISECTLFPELEYQARDITHKYMQGFGK
ncbi:MAG: FRG domain-containing protein [Candidatus Korobacteraceae bacterium]|jgi:FRG domain-containing protein